jgi:uncharacterized protein YjiK
MKSICMTCLCLILPALLIAQEQEVPLPARVAFPARWDKVLLKKDLKEPSGLCAHTARKTLFAVGDEGDVAEFKPDGTVVKHARVRDADFEGITHDPASGLLYIAVEGEEKVLELDPESLEVIREFQVPRQLDGKTVMKAGKHGIEGITFMPDAKHPQGGVFLVANQAFELDDPEELSAVFELELPLRDLEAEPRLLRYFEPGVIDLSGLYHDVKTGRIIVISDSNNLVMFYSPDYQCLSAHAYPGKDQEGVTVGRNGVMYIAQDSGGIVKLK